MRSRLQPGEALLAQTSVFWTDRPGAIPARFALLQITNQRLILAKPPLPPLALLALWPPVGLAGLALAGLPGALAAAAGLLALHLLLPKTVARTLPLTDVIKCGRLRPLAPGPLLQRERIAVTARPTPSASAHAAEWTLSPAGRHEHSADRIAQALQASGILVDEASAPRDLIGPHAPP